MRPKFIASLAALAAAGFAGAAAQAVPIVVTLPGTTQYDGWLDGSLIAGQNPGYGTFPGTTAWPAPIGSSAPGSGDAGLMKLSNGTGGGPYPASGSIYFGGFSGDLNVNGGTLAVSDATPVANLANVVLQIDIGEAATYDFFNHTLPVLSYNGGTQNLAPGNSGTVERVYTGTVTMPTGEEPVYRNTWLLQWDLSGVATPITAFDVKFTGVQHAQLYALRLDQSDTFSVVAVPEPASAALLALGGAAALLRRRRANLA